MTRLRLSILAANLSLNGSADLPLISNLCTNESYKDALLASYSQVEFLRNELNEKNLLIRSLIIRESEYEINNSNSNKRSGNTPLSSDGHGDVSSCNTPLSSDDHGDVSSCNTPLSSDGHGDVSSCNTPLSSDGDNNDDKVTESTPNRITLSFNNTFNFTCDDLQDSIDAKDSDGEGVTNENYFHGLYLQYIRDTKENEKKKLETQLSQIRASKHEEHCKNKESAFLQYENNSNGKFVIDRGIEIQTQP